MNMSYRDKWGLKYRPLVSITALPRQVSMVMCSTCLDNRSILPSECEKDAHLLGYRLYSLK